MQIINGNIEDYLEIIENKVVCYFGAGKTLERFFERYSYLNIDKTADFVIDNDANKCGKKYIYKGREIDILGVESIKRYNNIFIVIATLSALEIFEQLNNDKFFDDISCMITTFIDYETDRMKEKNRIYPSSFRITDDRKIPKKIHYCWFGNNKMSDLNKMCIESWYKHCPDYEIVLWNEDNYDFSKNIYMKEAYEAEKWGFVPDYARIDIIYNEGGIYLDTDVELIKNIDDFLYQDAFCAVDSSNLVSLGLGFGAKKENSFIKKMISVYDDISFINENNSYNNIPAPSLQKNFFENMGYVCDGNYKIIDNVTFLPANVFAGYNHRVGQYDISIHTYGIHHYEGTWASERFKEQLKKMHKLYKMANYNK